jgi:hypothetical protein
MVGQLHPVQGEGRKEVTSSQEHMLLVGSVASYHPKKGDPEMSLDDKELRVIVPRALLKAFEHDDRHYIPLSWRGIWPVPVEWLRDPDFVGGLIKEFEGGEILLNVRHERM